MGHSNRVRILGIGFVVLTSLSLSTPGFTAHVGMHTKCTVLAGAFAADDFMASDEARKAVGVRMIQLNSALAAKSYEDMYNIEDGALSRCLALNEENLGLATQAMYRIMVWNTQRLEQGQRAWMKVMGDRNRAIERKQSAYHQKVMHDLGE